MKPPVPLMKHSLASPSSVADVMAKKYADGLPLARQEKIWAREGVELSRATMANWVIQCAQTWLKPLYKHMKQHLLGVPAMPDGATVKTSKAAVGYQYCNKLFSLEKKCAALNNILRKEYSQNFISPVLEEYFCWVNTLDPEKGSADRVCRARGCPHLQQSGRERHPAFCGGSKELAVL